MSSNATSRRMCGTEQSIRRLINISILLLLFLIAAGCSDKKKRREWGSASGGKSETPQKVRLPYGAVWNCYRGSPSLSGMAPALPASPHRFLHKTYRISLRGQVSIADNRIFIGSGDGKLRVTDITSGEIIWTFDAGHGINGTPLVTSDIVFICNEYGVVTAISRKTHRQIWAYEAGGMFAGSPNKLTDESGKDYIVAGCHDGVLYCIDASTGELAWKIKTDDYINGTPALWKKYIVFGSCDGYLRICKSTGELIAKIELKDYIPDSPAISDGAAYVTTSGGSVFRVNLPEGTIAWRCKPGGDSYAEFTTSPAAGDGVVVVTGAGGKVYCIDMETGEVRREIPVSTHHRLDSSPVLSGDKALFGCGDGRIYMVDISTGKVIWSYATGGEVVAPLAVAGGLFAAVTTDGELFCFIGESR